MVDPYPGANKRDYNSQFGIVLGKREAVGIDPAKRLEAETLGVQDANQAMLEQIQDDFGVQPGEVDMLVLDQMVQDQYQTQPLIVLAAAGEKKSVAVPKIGVCVISPTYAQIQAEYSQVGRSINPDMDAENHFVPPDNPHMFGMTAEFMTGPNGEINSTVQVLELPKHGKLVSGNGEIVSDFANPVTYLPKSGYSGKDRITVRVTGSKGRSIVISYYINVTPAEARKDLHESGGYKKYCPNGQLQWKISLDSAPEYTENIQSLLTYTGISNSITLDVAKLPGTAVAKTAGPAITFDDNAAGFGWFVDATPGQNEEYLPTSNPNQWIAKEGSEAANKMDLLSALFHEYGHVLGIEHSADGNDFMAVTLQPGVRRLPSTEELTLMAQLAGQARLALDGLAGASGSAATPGHDAENDILTGAITVQPTHGSLTQNVDNTWTYTPEVNRNGTDEIHFSLSDGKLLSNDAVLTISVTPANNASTVGD